jgi:hypothetical protein
VKRSQSGRLLRYIKLSDPDGKKPNGTGPNRLTLSTPHVSVARAGRGVNVASAISINAMRSGRIRIFLN